jgi:hypothetical protein
METIMDEQAIAALRETADRLRDRARFRRVVADSLGRPLTAGEEPLPVILVVDEVSLLCQGQDGQRVREYLQDIARHGRHENVILHATE